MKALLTIVLLAATLPVMSDNSEPKFGGSYALDDDGNMYYIEKRGGFYDAFLLNAIGRENTPFLAIRKPHIREDFAGTFTVPCKDVVVRWYSQTEYLHAEDSLYKEYGEELFREKKRMVKLMHFARNIQSM